MSTIREQVLEQIVDLMATAEHEGLDPFEAAKAAFPGTPASVLGEAFAMLDMRQTEEWWQGVERTIDGEIIKAALLKSGTGGGE